MPGSLDAADDGADQHALKVGVGRTVNVVDRRPDPVLRLRACEIGPAYHKCDCHTCHKGQTDQYSQDVLEPGAFVPEQRYVTHSHGKCKDQDKGRCDHHEIGPGGADLIIDAEHAEAGGPKQVLNCRGEQQQASQQQEQGKARHVDGRVSVELWPLCTPIGEVEKETFHQKEAGQRCHHHTVPGKAAGRAVKDRPEPVHPVDKHRNGIAVLIPHVHHGIARLLRPDPDL